jgi:hypothetical protein
LEIAEILGQHLPTARDPVRGWDFPHSQFQVLTAVASRPRVVERHSGSNCSSASADGGSVSSIRHSVDMDAESVYEAAAIALSWLTKDD